MQFTAMTFDERFGPLVTAPSIVESRLLPRGATFLVDASIGAVYVD
jgi:hypothetical protein